MAGIWDTPPTPDEMQPAGGVWDAPPTEAELAHADATAKQAPGALQTFTLRALQTPTFGLAEEIGGALGAGAQALANALPKGAQDALDIVPADPRDAYRFIRDQSRRDEKAGAEAHPVAAGLGTAAGIAASLAMPGPKGWGGSAAQGALAGLGASEADLTKGEVLPAAGHALLGAGLGAAGHALARAGTWAFGKGASALGERAANFAEKRAAKALGAQKIDLNKMKPEQIREMARRALDEGIVRFGDRVDDVAPRAKAALQEAGERLGGVLEQADDAGARFDVDALRDRIAKELGQRVKGNPIREAQLRDAMAAARLGELDTSTGFAQINDIKAALGEGVFPKIDAKGKQRLAQQIAGIMSGEMGEQLGKARGPVAKDALEAAQKAYGASKDAAKISARAIKGLEGNRWLSPSDYGVGAASGAIGSLAGGPLGLATGPLLALAHKVLRERGASSLAVASDKASAGLRRAATSPAVGSALDKIQRLLRTPEGQRKIQEFVRQKLHLKS